MFQEFSNHARFPPVYLVSTEHNGCLQLCWFRIFVQYNIAESNVSRQNKNNQENETNSVTQKQNAPISQVDLLIWKRNSD